MKIEDIMTKKLITIKKDSNIQEIAKLMKEYDIGFVPITDENKIIGAITDRDIVINNVYNKTDNIIDTMSESIKYVDKNEDLDEALRLMGNYKVKRLIVTDDKKIVGIISLSDIVKKIDDSTFVNAFNSIYEINRNENNFTTEIDEFYL